MIQFLHIPKTAGSSFKYALLNVYRFKPYFEFDGNLEKDLIRLNSLSEKKCRKIHVVTGHAHRSTGVEWIDNMPTITFLREPVSRVKSYCRHVSEGKSKHLVEQFAPS